VTILFDMPGDPSHHWAWLDATASESIAIERSLIIDGEDQVTIASRLPQAFSIRDGHVTFIGLELRGHRHLGDEDPWRRTFYVGG
jgi:hypothetical protein